MNIFIIFAHPEPLSFNGAMFKAAVDTFKSTGWEVKTSDLYGMKFNPVSDRRNFTSVKNSDYLKLQLEEMHASEVNGFAHDIEAELQKLEWCDLMIWQFPLWWFGLPAILKGWADRVLAMGRTYGGGKVYDKGVFTGKNSMLSLTTGGPESSYGKDGFNGDINGVLRPIHRGILEFTGFKVLAPQIIYSPVRMTDEARKNFIEEYSIRLKNIENEKPIVVGSY